MDKVSMDALIDYLNVLEGEIYDDDYIVTVKYNNHTVLIIDTKNRNFKLTAPVLTRVVIDIYNNFFETIRFLYNHSFTGKFKGVVYTEGQYRFPYGYVKDKEIKL